MMKKCNNYPRSPGDFYETPEWVTKTVLGYLKVSSDIIFWEPAAGSGKMGKVIQETFPNNKLIMSDIEPKNEGIEKCDFLTEVLVDGVNYSQTLDTQINNTKNLMIITNPPYSYAKKFIERGLFFWKAPTIVLLRYEFDTAAKHTPLMRFCEGKVVLTRRIRWIEGSTKSPMSNHAWYVFHPICDVDLDRFTGVSTVYTKGV